MSDGNIHTEEFTVIDVETANHNYASICQIGVIRCRGHEIVEESSTLINPQTEFVPRFVEIHGIDEEQVRGAPTFAQWSERLHDFLDGRVVLSHSPYDQIAISRACESHEIAIPDSTWLDTVRVARCAWPERDTHRLDAMCDFLNFEFKHHHALHDARAAFHIFIKASEHKNVYGVSAWLDELSQSARPKK